MLTVNPIVTPWHLCHCLTRNGHSAKGSTFMTSSQSVSMGNRATWRTLQPRDLLKKATSPWRAGQPFQDEETDVRSELLCGSSCTRGSGRPRLGKSLRECLESGSEVGGRGRRGSRAGSEQDTSAGRCAPARLGADSRWGRVEGMATWSCSRLWEWVGIKSPSGPAHAGYSQGRACRRALARARPGGVDASRQRAAAPPPETLFHRQLPLTRPVFPPRAEGRGSLLR